MLILLHATMPRLGLQGKFFCIAWERKSKLPRSLAWKFVICQWPSVQCSVLRYTNKYAVRIINRKLKFSDLYFRTTQRQTFFTTIFIVNQIRYGHLQHSIFTISLLCISLQCLYKLHLIYVNPLTATDKYNIFSHMPVFLHTVPVICQADL